MYNELIGYSDDAISCINDAINNYESAVVTICATNNNEKTREIVSLIKTNIEKLNNIKMQINVVKGQISNAMRDEKNEGVK